jgi:hypothetical protein
MMTVDIGEKDKVAIACLHEVSSGVYFTEHDFGSTSTSFVTMDRLVALGPY